MRPTTPAGRPRAGASLLAETPSAERYLEVRRRSVRLAEPLSAEDALAQSMPEVSPAKWHLAHTTWFFETFVLRGHADGHEAFAPAYAVLFNSYYDGVGRQHPRARRGLITRPSLQEVLEYRLHVDDRVTHLLDSGDLGRGEGERIELGLQHEQQHQELMLTDIKHVLSCSPARPAYAPPSRRAARMAPALRWIRHDERLSEVGHDGDGFSFDNERPRHRAFVHAFEIASRPVTCGEYLEFMGDGGYERPDLWLADGWSVARQEGWRAPLYWEPLDGAWELFTLRGAREVDLSEPACHVSYYEADAFARWAGARLPTEIEWEVAAESVAIDGNLAESGALHASSAQDRDGGAPIQLFGDVWEWTSSAYLPYPGYRPFEGTLGEYNANFMCNQMVLRGGSCATPRPHVRRTYRNFFYPRDRWQFMGLRLARNSA